MIYDAVLVARRGLGADEFRLVSPGFLAAIRWAVYAEMIDKGADELRSMAGQDARGVAPTDLPRFIAANKAARDEVTRRRHLLLLDGADG